MNSVNCFILPPHKVILLLNEVVYDQIDNVAMGSPLGPVLANVFMGYHERNWINNCENSKPVFSTMYVNDIFCLCEHEDDGAVFLDYIHSQHTNIQFTIENEESGRLSYKIHKWLTRFHGNYKCTN